MGEQLNFDELKFDCIVVPEIKEVPETYANGHDIIADIELRLLEVDESIEDFETRKRKLENVLRMEIEDSAEARKLTNEKKRQIAYEELADCNDELNGFISWLKEARRERRKLGIELGNETRAFQLKLRRDQ